MLHTSGLLMFPPLGSHLLFPSGCLQNSFFILEVEEVDQSVTVECSLSHFHGNTMCSFELHMQLVFVSGQFSYKISLIVSFPFWRSPTRGTQVILLLDWLRLFSDAISFALIAFYFFHLHSQFV